MNKGVTYQNTNCNSSHKYFFFKGVGGGGQERGGEIEMDTYL